MQNLTDLLEKELNALGLNLNSFSEVLIRLLDYGVISRSQSQREAALYDRYLQCSELVEDYLRPLNLVFMHDAQFHFIRVFPPAAIVPGLAEDDHAQDSPFQNGFRTKPTPAVVAVMLILRVEYEKALREGKVDELGQVALPFEELAITMKNLLKKSLPESQTERKAIFRQLQQLRLIKYASESDLSIENSHDSWIKIDPSITSFITQDILDQLRSPTPPAVEEQQGEQQEKN